jgi:hypothetical protein
MTLSEGTVQGQGEKTAVNINVEKNGPYLVDGPFRLIDADRHEGACRAGLEQLHRDIQLRAPR